MEYRRGRSCSAKGPVIAEINPAARGIGFASGQNRNRRIVRMQTLSRHDMRLDQAPKRIEHMADGSHRVGHRRQCDRHAFQGVTFGLAVQWLVLSELLEHDHREKAWACPSLGNDMERRRRLGDLFAVTARELLAHRLDHLPSARLRFQCSYHVLAEFAQTASTTAVARRRGINHHALARQVFGECVAFRALAREPAHGSRSGDGGFRGQFVFRGVGLQLVEHERQLVDQSRRTFGTLPVQLSFQPGDPQFLMGDQGQVL